MTATTIFVQHLSQFLVSYILYYITQQINILINGTICFVSFNHNYIIYNSCLISFRVVLII